MYILLDKGTLELNNCRVHNCNASSWAGSTEGGLLYVAKGEVYLTNGTLLHTGTANSGNLWKVCKGAITYVLPAPLGTWMLAVLCEKTFVECHAGLEDDCDQTSTAVASVRGVYPRPPRARFETDPCHAPTTAEQRAVMRVADSSQPPQPNGVPRATREQRETQDACTV